MELDNNKLYKKTVNSCGLELQIYRLNHCAASIAEGDEEDEKWATIYSISTEEEFRNQGEATELVNRLKNLYESMGYKFGSTVPLNRAMERVLEKTRVEAYE